MAVLPTRTVKTALFRSLGNAHLLALVPILSLGAYWAAGEMALIAIALALPLVIAALEFFGRNELLRPVETDPLTGFILRDGLIDWGDRMARVVERSDRQIACIVMAIDDLDVLEERFGRSMRDAVLAETAERLKRIKRDEDVLARLGDGFALGLMNVRAPETENLLMLAQRLQTVADEPFSDGPTRTYCSISMGIAAQSHVRNGTGANVVAGAQRAAELATVSVPGAIRVYSEGLSAERAHERDVARELSNALESGEIFAWFQPQLRTDSGKITGFEALARWEHPDRGMVSPASFLPDIEKAGLSQRLAEVILKQSLMALNAWDAAGFQVPTVSVNFSTEELRNPRLADYILWELDRHQIEPERLCVEVLESVMAEQGDDTITNTLSSLSKIGCRVDLDDFGTGFTSFINIRRFSVGRIKLDRSLVSHLDRDTEQKKMIAALLAFSSELGIETLAEGVETEDELATLLELGCEEMQGYVAARPMSLGESFLWLEDKAVPGAPAIGDSARAFG